MEVNYYIIHGKSDDYGACTTGVYAGDHHDLIGHVYFFQQIPKSHYNVLIKYFNDINYTDYKDCGYETLGDYLEEYY